MKITLKSQYDHFTTNRKPKYIEWTNEPAEITCYANEFVKTINTPPEKSIALLLEPRCLYGDIYEWIQENADKFKYIFTHDRQLLKLQNARRILFGGVWEAAVMEKTKNVSMIASNKRLCPLHIARSNLARQLENKIDTYGSYCGRGVTTIDAHAPYRFAVVVENYIDDWYFTEKICNCFASKCIPVYYGAKKITSLFNADGIIQVPDLEEIPLLIDALDEAEYNKRLEAVEDNYNRVKDYYCFEDWFYRTYKDLLEDI